MCGDSTVAPSLRMLAARGDLARAAGLLPPDRLRALREHAYAVVWRVVYGHHTRPLELRRRHRRCAISFQHLAPECHDRFQDDVESVVDYLLRYAKQPIDNLEGWITSRLSAATVDGHRRRRGLTGAQQRPRVPAWLATALGHDPWLLTLARHVIEWAGIPVTAGHELWPIDEWASLREVATGQQLCADARSQVAHEIEIVLRAMRERRPDWYLRYVELPLGHKQAPVAPEPVDGIPSPERRALPPATRDERDEAGLDELATLALEALEARLRAGEDPVTAVRSVVRLLFLGQPAANADLDSAPGSGGGDRDEWLSVALGDPAQVEWIVAEVLDILRPGSGAGARRPEERRLSAS